VGWNAELELPVDEIEFELLLGCVESLARPGGNATGFTLF
jgi:hypothetical protein